MTTPSTANTKPHTPQRLPRWLSRTIKAVLFTALGLVLTFFATIFCVVTVLTPDRLTGLVTRLANENLDADLTIGRIELSMHSSFPFLRLDIDSLTIVSRALDKLSAPDRAALPSYADTLFTLDGFHGSINVLELLRMRISLHDVAIDGPGCNIVVAREGINNFNIYTPKHPDEADSTGMKLPQIEIDGFQITNPKRIQFYDAVSSTWGAVDFRKVILEGIDAPAYTLDITGDFFAPILHRINLASLPFALQGTIRWDPSTPDIIGLERLDIFLAFMAMKLSTELDFSRDLVVRSADMQLGPVRVSDFLNVVPDSMRTAWGMHERLTTDAAIRIDMRLDRPFNTSTDTVPTGSIDITIPDCHLDYGDVHLDKLGLGLTIASTGNDPALISANLKRLAIAGPMTDITISGTASDLTGDPQITGSVHGTADFDRMPHELADLLPGEIRGKLSSAIDFDVRRSMLTANTFHRMRIKGDINGDHLFWLDNDSLTMAWVNGARFRFGTNEVLTDSTGHRIDSLLTASLDIDTANIVYHDYEFKSSNFALSFGASNRHRTGDTTMIVPMEGRMHTRRFDFRLLTDTTTVRARDINGSLTMRRYHGEPTRPQFIFDLDCGRISAGTPDTRVMISKANIHFDAHRMPPNPRRLQIKAMADSLRRVNPNIAPDSAFAMAYRRYAHRGRSHLPTHLTTADDSLEVIDWGTSHLLRQALLDWQLSGTITAQRGALFSWHFPMRNRMRDFNMTFNNDSLVFTNVAFKAGHTDALASGRITDIRRSLTARGLHRPLKMRFKLRSDTIDINQLAACIFAGAAQAAERSVASLDDDIDRREDDIESELETYSRSDREAPLLVPVNVDAEFDLQAANVYYSDIDFHDLNGKALLYDGAINLNNLSARSSIGRAELSALYSAPSASDIRFGFGLMLNGFQIDRFLSLVPVIDSIVPLLRDVSGIIDANLAATVDIDRRMNLDLPSLKAAVRLSGDSLVLLDAKTFHTVAKWLLFKDKKRNMIDHMDFEFVIDSGMMHVYPFIFNIDRYRLGIQGSNSLDLDFKYHIAVLKSPIPFKFGINLSGNRDKLKVRLGGAHFNEQSALQQTAIVNTTRINLLDQIEGVFRRGVRNSNFAQLDLSRKPIAADIDLNADTITHADSLMFIREGLIPAQPIDTLP